MKHYAYIFLILCAAIIFFGGCRSNRVLQKTSTATQQVDIEQSISTQETSQVSGATTNNTVTQENEVSENTSVENAENTKKIDEYTHADSRATYYDKDGNVRAVVETSKRSGRLESRSGRAGSSNVSTTNIRSISIGTSDTKTDALVGTISESNTGVSAQGESAEVENTAQTNDSRPLQGHEWLFVVIPSVIAILIYCLIRKKKD